MNEKTSAEIYENVNLPWSECTVTFSTLQLSRCPYWQYNISLFILLYQYKALRHTVFACLFFCTTSIHFLSIQHLANLILKTHLFRQRRHEIYRYMYIQPLSDKLYIRCSVMYFQPDLSTQLSTWLLLNLKCRFHPHDHKQNTVFPHYLLLVSPREFANGKDVCWQQAISNIYDAMLLNYVC